MPAVMEAWSVSIEEKKAVKIEYRLIRIFEGSDGVRSQAWVLGQAVPELNEDGTVKGILGSMTDISQFKWAESVQHIRAERYLESKRQQEKSALPFLPSLAFLIY